MIKYAAPCGLAIFLTLTGCTSPDRVLFVTTTDIGISADATTQTALIGYDRLEGMVGPAYVETGAVPHTVGVLKSNLSIFNPDINQIYATGLAADRVTDGSDTEPPPVPKLPSTGERRIMFFGTSSNLGLKLGWAAQGYPSSINLGYKRKEYSLIPLQKNLDGGKEDYYPPVFASISVNQSTGLISDTSTALHQFFATGQAAVNLASDDQFKRPLKAAVKEATSQAAPIWLADSGSIADCISRSSGSFDDAAKKRIAMLTDLAKDKLPQEKADYLKSLDSKEELENALLGGLLSDVSDLRKLIDQNNQICQ
jgi:hypothetical protein